MNHDDILRMAREAGVPMEYSFVANATVWHLHPSFERFANLVAAAEREKYSPIGTVAGGAGERTFMHPSVKYILPIGLQLYARIEVREEDKK